MNRHEWLWLAVKVIGIYMLTTAISGLLSAALIANEAGWLAAKAAAPGLLIGGYLTFGGEALLEFAGRASPSDGSRPTPPERGNSRRRRS